MRRLDQAWVFRLKAATRDLIAAAGGYDRAETIAGVAKSTLHRCGAADRVDLISLTAAALLEADCGAPLVTAVLAEMQGRRLAEAGEVSAAPLARAHALFSRATAELQATICEAEADGRISPRERVVIEREASRLADKLAVLRQANARGGR